MQGDIQLPRPKRPKAAPKPKIITKPAALKPDIVINEAAATQTSRRTFAPHKHFLRFWRWWLSLGRNERFALIAACLLIFGAAAIGWFYFIQPNSEPSLTLIRHPKPKPAPPVTAASPLTGLQVAPDLAKRPVTGIMIENSQEARPQSGLQDAGVVYEAIAEGGITRFLSLFQDAQPQYIGPVRSLRPYYIDFAAPFQASIVHVGGSPDALSIVRSGNYRDLDQFFNGGYFSRISARPAPHNVYTSFAKLDALNHSKGYTSSLFTSWPRKADKKLAVPTAKTIDLAISGPIYYAHYDYDAASNSYLRSEGGAPHMDLTSAGDKTGVRLQPKVVIALIMSYRIAADGKHSIYGDTGSGQAFIFQDGGVTAGSWSKADTTSQISFADADGAPLKLNAGQTWITLVAAANKVTYKP
jgi:hypothetical protein